jgi:hypothetical protein
MNFVKGLALLASLFVTSLAIACPERCLCDHKGHVVSDYRHERGKSDRDLNNQIKNSQSQSQSQTSTNVNNNQSTSTSSSSVVTKVTATGGTATVTADDAGTNNGNGSNNTTVTSVVPRQVATAYAASLTSGQDVCVGSLSGGAQTGIFGLSLGGTKTDDNCVLIKQVQLLQQLGFQQAACFRARQGKEGKPIDDAMKAAGVDCVTLSSPVPADVVTHEELRDHEKRIVTTVLSK